MENLRLFKAQVQAELNRLEAQSTAKEVAGKAIGKQGLGYITAIVMIGVVASLYLEESKIAAVMGLLGSALTALISMLNGIAGATPKQEKPEFEIMRQLIEQMNRPEEPVKVDVNERGIKISKGDHAITTSR